MGSSGARACAARTPGLSPRTQEFTFTHELSSLCSAPGNKLPRSPSTSQVGGPGSVRWCLRGVLTSDMATPRRAVLEPAQPKHRPPRQVVHWQARCLTSYCADIARAGRLGARRPRTPSPHTTNSAERAGRLGDLYRCAARAPPCQCRIMRLVAACAQLSPARAHIASF